MSKSTTAVSRRQAKAKLKQAKAASDLQHKRINDSFLGPAERVALTWLAARMPAWVNPDILTGIGFFGTIIIFAGYALTQLDKGFLWLSSLGFLINWFGDSLDGSLARYRHIERPRYGFFIDHTTDAFSQIFVFFGLGLSPYIRFDVATIALVSYLLMSVLVYVRTYVTGVFKLSYIKLGPTELRLIIILSNALVFFVGNPSWVFKIGTFSVFDFIIMALTITIFIVFVVSVLRNGIAINREEMEERARKHAQDTPPQP